MVSSMRRHGLLLATALPLFTLGAVAQETPVKIVATIAVEGAFAEIEPRCRRAPVCR